MSGASEQEYFADGMVEDITTELSRFRELFVIARTSAFTYKGKACLWSDRARTWCPLRARRFGPPGPNNVRVTAQLIDATSGAISGPSATIAPQRHLRHAGRDNLQRRRGDRADAGQAEQQRACASRRIGSMPGRPISAAVALLQIRGEDNRTAQAFFRQAIALDPNFRRPLRPCARLYWDSWLYSTRAFDDLERNEHAEARLRCRSTTRMQRRTPCSRS